jgi:hypothetical protein
VGPAPPLSSWSPPAPGSPLAAGEGRCLPGTRLLPVLLSALAAAGGCSGEERPGGPEPGPESRTPSPLDGLAPRRAVRGLEGFRSRSRVVFAGRPEDPHELIVACVFPGRALWRLRREEARAGERRLQYWCGERVFLIPEAEGVSTELEGEETARARLRMELRRALMLWPAEHSWSGGGAGSRTTLGGLGGLEASHFDPKGRPGSLAALLPDGLELERLEAIRWREESPWPAAWELVANGRLLWREEVLEVQTDVGYLDAYFIPPDRLGSLPASLWDRSSVQRMRVAGRGEWIGRPSGPSPRSAGMRSGPGPAPLCPSTRSRRSRSMRGGALMPSGSAGATREYSPRAGRSFRGERPWACGSTGPSVWTHSCWASSAPGPGVAS